MEHLKGFELSIKASKCSLLLAVWMLVAMSGSRAQLSSSFYKASCPTVASVVEEVVQQAVQKDARMAASLLRLHFHDCFVHGCDGSILLDDMNTVTGEKTAAPNLSLRGFDVVDEIKTAVEAVCKATVSCADIVALAAKASVSLVGGPSWTVRLGRRDATSSASPTEVLQILPDPNSDMSTLISKFTSVGLTAHDTVVLSGAHTIGQAGCGPIISRLYNFSGTGKPDPSIDTTYLASLQSRCPQGGGNANTLNPLDINTPTTFDNTYFTNLQSHKGLLLSDQELTSDSHTASLAKFYASSQSAFFAAFAKSMVSMGNISPLTGSQGEIRLNCHAVNP